MRNVSLTAPYMHDGSLPTLEAVVDFLDRGGNPNPNLDGLMKPLHLTAEEKSALVAFLKTLTEEKWARIALPHSELMQVIKKDIPPTPPYQADSFSSPQRRTTRTFLRTKRISSFRFMA